MSRLFTVPGLALFVACNEPAPPAASAALSPSSDPAASAAPSPPSDPAAPPALGPSVALRPLEGFTSAQPPDPGAFSVSEPATPPILTGGTNLKIAAVRDGPLRLDVLGDDLFVGGAGGLARVDGDGRVVPLPHSFTGQAIPTYAYDYWSATLSGRWPDNAWLVTSWQKSGADSVTFVHRRDGDTWQVLDNRDGPVRWYPIDAIWRSGQLLGLRNIDLGTDDDAEGLDRTAIQARVRAERLRFEAYVATPTPTVTPTPMLAFPRFDYRFEDAAAAPTGELFLLGSASGVDGPFSVQRWGFAGADPIEGTIDELPGKARCWWLVVRAADDAHVGCEWFGTVEDPNVARLYRFDGARWSEVSIPPGAISVEHVAQAPAGDLWIILGFESATRPTTNQIFHQPTRDGPWTRIPLPTLRFPDVAGTPWIWDEDQYVRTPPEPELAKQTWNLEPKSIHVRGPDDVWVVARTDLRRDILGNPAYRHVLLHTDHIAEPLTMLHDLDLDREVRDWHPSPPWRADEPCFRDLPAFVTLRTLGPDDPADTLDSAVKAFVRGNPGLLAHVTAIFEVHRRGRRAVGVFTNPPDQAAADALLAAVSRIAPDEPHLLECRQPRVRRQFDSRTGRPFPDP